MQDSQKLKTTAPVTAFCSQESFPVFQDQNHSKTPPWPAFCDRHTQIHLLVLGAFLNIDVHTGMPEREGVKFVAPSGYHREC